jgi:hypothetical protein
VTLAVTITPNWLYTTRPSWPSNQRQQKQDEY